MTLGQFDALLDRHLEAHRRQMLYAGITAAAIYNAAPFGAPDRKPISPLDFVPDVPRPLAAGVSQTLEQQIKVLTDAMGCGPGKVN